MAAMWFAMRRDPRSDRRASPGWVALLDLPSHLSSHDSPPSNMPLDGKAAQYQSLNEDPFSTETKAHKL